MGRNRKLVEDLTPAQRRVHEGLQRLERGLPWLVDKTGIPYPTLYLQIYSNKELPLNTAAKVAQVLSAFDPEMTLDWLMTGEKVSPADTVRFTESLPSEDAGIHALSTESAALDIDPDVVSRMYSKFVRLDAKRRRLAEDFLDELLRGM